MCSRLSRGLIVDLNQLYSDHQIAVMRAGPASSRELHHARHFAASLIAGRIGCMQRALGASAAAGWETLAAPHSTDFSSRSLALRAPGGRNELVPGEI